MEVPFLSSSAINREHYNLVQSIETAATPQKADDVLLHEVETVRERLKKRSPSSSQCAELLILLLYCWTATTLGRVTRASLEFALPHAVTLAEAGSTIKQKRTGYLFCTEVMLENDELQIMLVNTLRKDLGDPDIARICLALDVLSLNCPLEAIPAVTPRLLDLMAHHSPHVKRKSMVVLRRICLLEHNTLSNVAEKLQLRLKDPAPGVSGVAFDLLEALTRVRIFRLSEAVNLALQGAFFTKTQSHDTRTQSLRLKFAEFIRRTTAGLLADEIELEMQEKVVKALYQMLNGATGTEHALILETFRAISKYPVEILSRHLPLIDSKILPILDQMLRSLKPNDQYVGISCLLALDVALWAGNTPGIPPVFDENQVQMIMHFLDASDSIVRKMTLQVLHRVDQQILAMHLMQLLSVLTTSTSHDRHRKAERVLEVSAVYDSDGEAYANRLRDLAIAVNEQDGRKGMGKTKHVGSGVGLVLENLVEQVLLHLRSSSEEFLRSFVDTTIRIPASDAGPTLTLVIAATVCEYGALSSVPPEALLEGLAGRLGTNPPAIQEALLLAMLRATARCEIALPGVSNLVRTVHEVSRSHIRRRCEQYLSLSSQMGFLKHIAALSKSDTLPDFLLALETMEAQPESLPQTRHRSSDASGAQKSQSPTAVGKLRYDAYDPPRPAAKLTRRPSSTASIGSHATSSRSGRSDSLSSSHSPRRDDGGPDDALTRTLTAGDLALAAHEPDFVRSASIPSPNLASGSQRGHRLDDLMAKADLITLDSPFLAEPSHSVLDVTAVTSEQQAEGNVDFQGAWDMLRDNTSSRGWCESSPETVVRRFEALPDRQTRVILPEIEPYPGELKIIVLSRLEDGAGLSGAIRLRPGDEGSTLWQMRCLDRAVRDEMRRVMDDERSP